MGVDPLTHVWDLADTTGITHGIDAGPPTEHELHLSILML